MSPAAALEGPPGSVMDAGKSGLGCGAAPSDLLVEVDAVPAAVDAARFTPHKSQAAAAPPREAFAAAGSPVIVTGAPALHGIQTLNGSPDQTAQLPLNTRAMDVETDLFKGRIQLTIRGTPGAEAAARPGGALSCGRRSFHVAIQGRFKRAISAAELLSGQEYPKAPRTPSLMHFVFSGAARVFAATNEVHVKEGEPMHFHYPAIASAQLINVSRPGEEPDPLEAEEDVTLWAPDVAGRGGAPLASAARARFFDKPSNLAGRVVGPEYVWTMHIHQALIDFTTYKLGLPGVPVGIDLVNILDAQPLQIMAKDGKSGEYVFNLLVWSRRLLYAHADAEEAAAGSVSEKIKGRFKGLLSGW
ncbi:hypothetical protein Rsub_00063 [Raphidocelis subcapitata]|uniref:Domain of unknown function at the cortex 1 domain-containing protein n=1 Tax=Raphidocelis subcapitata TaxID=307507 RepID=A0A2V0NLV3_9CHLO|nr:hypothetical protein Rsub_00063 [Raphidocelis subcapitata]|eukprot:GBF87352.1 hypothetical protein Rsub_00063 [Raphidocelis subcapitata]